MSEPAINHESMNQEVALRGLADAHLTRARMAITLVVLGAVLVVVAMVAAAFGSVHIDLMRAISDRSSADHAILFGARIPRVLMGATVGAVLAAGGAGLRALVRNPLAEGGILGISGGGAFGAIAALVVFSHLGGSDVVIPLCAF